MWQFFKQFKYLVITLALISSIFIYLFYQALSPKKTLPILNPNDVSAEMVDDSIRHIKKYHHIADFLLLNQYNEPVSLNTVKGKIHIADFFFTSCSGVCPILTKNMKAIQDIFLNDDKITLLSFSVTPNIDSVSVLKDYAKEKGVIRNKWHLLTGDKKTIYSLARTSYLSVKDKPDTPIEDDMIHTENFILVDSQYRIRGFYDGTDNKEIQKLITDAKLLQSEL